MNKESIEVLEKHECQVINLKKNQCYCLVEFSNFNKINDSITLLEQSDLIWKEILVSNKIKRIKQVSVILYDLEPLESAQTNFFQYLNNNFENTIKKRKSLSDTIDIINSKFGRDSITIGSLPKNISDFSGTKVAFTRIPDIKEFYE